MTHAQPSAPVKPSNPATASVAGEPDPAGKAHGAAAEPPAPPPSSPPPRGPALWKILVATGVLLLTLGLGVILSAPLRNLWHSAADSEDAAQAEPAANHPYYTCGMHPWVILPHPGDCPICNMKLVPIEADKFSGEVTINPVVAQNIGIRLSEVTSGPVTKTTRTVGTIAYDETRVRDINIKVGGWIEKLHVDSLGQVVQRGDPLFEIYSPELYAAQEEYLLAWKYRHKNGTGAAPDAPAGNDDLLNAARTKLDFFDITPKQIQALQQRDTLTKTMTIESPYGGVVVSKDVNEGMKVMPGTQIYRVADLSKVWVMVTLYEYQLPYVELGQAATMRLTYLPGQEFHGIVTYIYPYLNEKTRQVMVRLEFDNPTGLLKPGMYTTVDLESTLARHRTLVPRSAVIDTGERKVAFVSLGAGRFEPRHLKTGAEAQNGMMEVLDGLKPGEMVVTSGQFLIDSEANVREALAKMIKGDLAAGQQPSVVSAGRSEVQSLPVEAAQALNAIINNYLEIESQLAADTTASTADPARQLAQEVDAMLKVDLPAAPHFWHQHGEVATVRAKALELAQAKTIDAARLAFADLSFSLDKLLLATGVPPSFDSELQELHCPMYREGQGGTLWLQRAGPVNNPYFGAMMLGCFDSRKALPVTGQGPATPTAAPPAPDAAIAPAPALPAALPADQQTQVDALAQAYLQTHRLLAADKFDGVAALVKNIHTTADDLAAHAPATVAVAAKQTVAASAAEPQTIEAARLQYKQLSQAVIGLLQLTPPSAQVAPTLYLNHCPMTKSDWLQTDQKIANPYYGQAMPTCGEVVGAIRSLPAK